MNIQSPSFSKNNLGIGWMQNNVKIPVIFYPTERSRHAIAITTQADNLKNKYYLMCKQTKWYKEMIKIVIMNHTVKLLWDYKFNVQKTTSFTLPNLINKRKENMDFTSVIWCIHKKTHQRKSNQKLGFEIITSENTQNFT